jgi:hypothetical protein
VVAERLDGYKRVHERALCLAVLKVKAHMQSAATEPAHRPDFSVERLRERNLKGPNLEVFLSQPKNLLFTYYAQNLTKVVFFWGLSNEVVRRIVPNDPVPGLDTPSVTAVYFSREDAVVGCSFAATKDSSQDPVDALATLIDRFDFTTEYLRLSSLGSRPQSRPQPGDNETDEILRQFTEAL